MPINTTLENIPNSILDNLLGKKNSWNNLEFAAGPPALKDPRRISVQRWMGTALCSLRCTGSPARGTLVLLGTEGVRSVVFYYCALIS